MIEKVSRLYRERKLFKGIIKYLFSFKQTVLYNGVLVREKRFLFSNNLKNRPHFQGGEIEAHRRYTKIGDRVIVIGGGAGVSAIYAATKVGENGKVHIYESNVDAIKYIKKNILLNKVINCEVHHGFVGAETNNKYAKGNKVRNVSVDSLPKCDVLEMDCEGAEVEILKKLTNKPRVIIVEVHTNPVHGSNVHPEWVINDIKEKGYDIVFRATTGGYEIDNKTLIEYLHKNSRQEKQSMDPYGEPKCPVIIVGLRKNI